MSAQTIEKPVVTSGDGYSWFYSAYLHSTAGLLRTFYWSLAGSSKEFDRITYVETAGLGTGRVRIAVDFPRSKDGSLRDSSDQGLPLVIVLESGGFVIGQPENGVEHVRRIADESLPKLVFHSIGHANEDVNLKTGAIAISVDYAKAPRHPYPHAVLQIYEVLRWALSARDQGIVVDPSRVCILGFSAGGTLSAALSLLLSFSEGPCAVYRRALPSKFKLRFQILVYPNIGCNVLYRERFAAVSTAVRDKSMPVWLLEVMEYCYLPPFIPKDQVFAAPLCADGKLLMALKPPPALVIAGGMDALHAEGRAYSEKLQRAGVQSRFSLYEHGVHGFTHIRTNIAVNVEEKEASWQEIIGQLNDAFVQ